MKMNKIVLAGIAAAVVLGCVLTAGCISDAALDSLSDAVSDFKFESTASTTLDDGTVLDFHLSGEVPAAGSWKLAKNPEEGLLFPEDVVMELNYDCCGELKSSRFTDLLLWGRNDDGTYKVYNNYSDMTVIFTLNADGTFSDEFGHVFVKLETEEED